MKLLTKEIEKKLVAARELDGEPIKDRPIVVKFFTPDANATWYVVDGEPLKENGEIKDWMLFGWMDLGLGAGMAELGYVSLNELKSLKGPLGLNVERDMYYDGHKLGEVMN